MNDPQKHSTRVAVISALVSLVLSIVFAAYIVGQRTGKVLDIEKWRNENSPNVAAIPGLIKWQVDTAPRIERMDAQGTLSQQFFIKSYAEEQGKQYKQLEELQKQVNHLEMWTWRIQRLEQAVTDGKPLEKQRE